MSRRMPPTLQLHPSERGLWLIACCDLSVTWDATYERPGWYLDAETNAAERWLTRHQLRGDWRPPSGMPRAVFPSRRQALRAAEAALAVDPLPPRDTLSVRRLAAGRYQLNDGEFEVTREPGQRSWQVTRSRDSMFVMEASTVASAARTARAIAGQNDSRRRALEEVLPSAPRTALP